MIDWIRRIHKCICTYIYIKMLIHTYTYILYTHIYINIYIYIWCIHLYIYIQTKTYPHSLSLALSLSLSLSHSPQQPEYPWDIGGCGAANSRGVRRGVFWWGLREKVRVCECAGGCGLLVGLGCVWVHVRVCMWVRRWVSLFAVAASACMDLCVSSLKAVFVSDHVCLCVQIYLAFSSSCHNTKMITPRPVTASFAWCMKAHSKKEPYVLRKKPYIFRIRALHIHS